MISNKVRIIRTTVIINLYNSPAKISLQIFRVFTKIIFHSEKLFFRRYLNDFYIYANLQCLKNVRIRSYSAPNAGKYGPE